MSERMTAVEKAVERFYDAAYRLAAAATSPELVNECIQCLWLIERIPTDLRDDFELDGFLTDIAVDRSSRLLAA